MFTTYSINTSKNLLGHFAFVGLAIAFLICTAARSEANTLNTYAFTQGGYRGGLNGVLSGTASLSGSFTGIVEHNGLIELADLTKLTYIFDAPSLITFSGDGFANDPVRLFSFDTNGGTSTLDFALTEICVGAAAAFGLCGLSGGISGIMATSFTTNQLPAITLVSSERIATSVWSATVPTPSALMLFAPAITSLLLSLRRRKATVSRKLGFVVRKWWRDVKQE